MGLLIVSLAIQSLVSFGFWRHREILAGKDQFWRENLRMYVETELTCTGKKYFVVKILAAKSNFGWKTWGCIEERELTYDPRQKIQRKKILKHTLVTFFVLFPERNPPPPPNFFTARSLKIEQGLPKNLVWKKTTWVLITVTYILKILMTRFVLLFLLDALRESDSTGNIVERELRERGFGDTCQFWPITTHTKIIRRDGLAVFMNFLTPLLWPILPVKWMSQCRNVVVGEIQALIALSTVVIATKNSWTEFLMCSALTTSPCFKGIVRATPHFGCTWCQKMPIHAGFGLLHFDAKIRRKLCLYVRTILLTENQQLKIKCLNYT